MKITRCALLVLAVVAMTIRTASAVTVVVPTDYTTIQGAIDSGADVVQVMQGSYTENVTIARSLVLTAHPGTSAHDPEDFPTLNGTLTFATASNAEATVDGFRITGLVDANAGGFSYVMRLRSCRLEGGLNSTNTGSNSLRVRGCIISGPVTVNAYSSDFSCNTVLGGGVDANEEVGSKVRYCHVQGPADFGIRVNNNDNGFDVYGNTVNETVDGILVAEGGSLVVHDNHVSECTDDAFALSGGSAEFNNNTAANCGGDGIDFAGAGGVAIANQITDVAGAGIRAGALPLQRIRNNAIQGAGSHGILAENAGTVALNTVLRAMGDGIQIGGIVRVDSNVVGRSAGQGIAISNAGASSIRHNTVYLSGQAGFQITGDNTAVDHNIAHGNGTFGLVWSGPSPAADCNDYILNTSGATSGAAPGPNDLFVNAHFCDLANDIVTLSSSSPLLNDPDCGSIGAKGEGCTTALAVPDGPVDFGSRFQAQPQPATGPLRFVFPRLEEPGRIQVYDVRGARVWETTVRPGEGSVGWAGMDRNGRRLGAGVYFATLEHGSRREQTRVILAD